MEILDVLNEIFRDIFDDDNLVIERATNADDIDDWDSLSNINIVVAIEKRYQVKFALGELQELQNVGDMVDLIEKKITR